MLLLLLHLRAKRCTIDARAVSGLLRIHQRRLAERMERMFMMSC